MKNLADSSRPAATTGLETSRDTVHAVTRALAVLDAFHVDEQSVSLAELSRRLAMGKTTVLRTARTLALSGYLTQTADARWRLGPAAGWLGVRYQTSFDVNNIIDALLRRLHGVTNETAAFFVREGNWRTCVARVDRLSMTRVHLRVGEKLPLDKGASGRVLLAFAGQRGDLYEQIRRSGFYVSMGERDPTMSSIAIPVFRASRELFGALCISGQANRLTHEVLHQHLKPLIDAGAELSRSLAAHRRARAR